jgi:glycosyltransferase involved in cell wall biosynthesis
MKNNTKISVIIPAHNEESIIEQSIVSVQNQTFKDFEIIVSNDGSVDRTRNIVERLIKKDKRIKILNRIQGHSAAFARNRGAEIAKGKILVFLDADCIINKIFLEEVYKKFEEYSEIDAVITISLPIKEKFMSKILSGFIAPPFKLKLDEGTVYDKSNCVEAGSMFFCISKKAYQKMKGYSEEIFYYEDEEFTKKFYELGFKSTLAKRAVQYFELPATFKGFVRQCNWIGKGINSIKDKKEKNKHKKFWFLKSLFLISPIFFVFNLNYFKFIFWVTFFISYIGLVIRNKKPLFSFIVTPFLYIKTLLVSFSIIKFS